MKTDVDTALKEIADWYVKHRREITEPELEAILLKHCEDEAEVRKFVKFLETEPGQLRFKTLLRERKGGGSSGRSGNLNIAELRRKLAEYKAIPPEDLTARLNFPPPPKVPIRCKVCGIAYDYFQPTWDEIELALEKSQEWLRTGELKGLCPKHREEEEEEEEDTIFFNVPEAREIL